MYALQDLLKSKYSGIKESITIINNHRISLFVLQFQHDITRFRKEKSPK